VRFGVTASSPGLGGGGGGGPSPAVPEEIDYLVFDDTDGTHYYEASSAEMRGGSDFVLALIYRPLTWDPGTMIVSAGNPDAGSPNGFHVREFYGKLEFKIALGDTTTSDVGYADAFSWYGLPKFRVERDALHVFRVYQNAAVTRIESWVNGALTLRSDSASGGFTPGSSNFRVGSRGYSVGGGISAVAYKAGTVTDAEIAAFFEAAYRAKNLVDSGIAWDHRYTMADSPASAAWADLEPSSPVNLARAGAQMAIETRLVRWA